MVTAKSEETGYVPPFEVSAKAINLIAEISRQIERYAIRLEQEDGLRLRKANRIKAWSGMMSVQMSVQTNRRCWHYSLVGLR